MMSERVGERSKQDITMLWLSRSRLLLQRSHSTYVVCLRSTKRKTKPTTTTAVTLLRRSFASSKASCLNAPPPQQQHQHHHHQHQQQQQQDYLDCCDNDTTGNKALYVENPQDNGELMFTGIIRTTNNTTKPKHKHKQKHKRQHVKNEENDYEGENNDNDDCAFTYIKLDDPNDTDIDVGFTTLLSKGHEMDEMEVACEYYHYGIHVPGIRRIDRSLYNFRKHPHQMVQMDLLLDGKYVVDEVEYDVRFPFPNFCEYPYHQPSDPEVPKQIRPLDGVFCMTKAKGGANNELFWSTVVAVAANANLTVQSKADVPSLGIKEYDLLAFPVTNVLFLKKGPNWRRREPDTKTDTSI